MRLCLYKETPFRVPVKKLKHLFGLIVDIESEPDSTACVNIIFTTDAALRKLNNEFRKLDRTTDVLSFNIESSGGPESIFGEIYISIATARRQAREYKGTFTEELVRLVCHGLLHLFGYDHQIKKDEMIMKELEGRYINQLIGN